MNLVFNIAVYNQTSNAIRNAAVSLMEALNFRVASRKIKVQAMHTLTLDILPEFDAGLISLIGRTTRIAMGLPIHY